MPQTLAMAYGAFVAQRGRFVPCVYEAVNLGGDTDSTASIVAAMSVMKNMGINTIPTDLEEIQRLIELRAVSHALAHAIA